MRKGQVTDPALIARILNQSIPDPPSDTAILDWLDENTKEDGYPMEGWMQDMGYNHFTSIREWAIHQMDNN
jgi:hypothetical protein